ncbi:MAG: hypothetical protein AB1894_04345 [Chloroflexota bacterium]
MKIDTGLAIVIVAVLIFYLRLIILQRERAKRIARASRETRQKKDRSRAEVGAPRYSILSQKRSDLIIAGAGLLAIVLGVLLNAGLLPLFAVQPYWWMPTSIGIVAFSWAFKL